jgi:hypothetical protein
MHVSALLTRPTDKAALPTEGIQAPPPRGRGWPNLLLSWSAPTTNGTSSPGLYSTSTATSLRVPLGHQIRTASATRSAPTRLGERTAGGVSWRRGAAVAFKRRPIRGRAGVGLVALPRRHPERWRDACEQAARTQEARAVSHPGQGRPRGAGPRLAGRVEVAVGSSHRQRASRPDRCPAIVRRAADTLDAAAA